MLKRASPTLQEVVDDPGGNKMLLVMDYMEGGPVLTREGLERGRRIPEPLALQYFRDMCKVRVVGSRPSGFEDSSTCERGRARQGVISQIQGFS